MLLTAVFAILLLPRATTACNGILCGNECKDSKVVCDGYRDCPDGSDEINCPCSDNQYQCLQGPCIHENWVCDGTKDCAQGDDEIDCETCQQNEFKCFKGKQCVEGLKRCDGKPDCKDLSDEANCVSSKNGVIKVTYKGSPGWSVCADHYNNDSYALICEELGMGVMRSLGSVPMNGTEPTLSFSPSKGFNNIIDRLQPRRCTKRRKMSLSCSQRKCGKRALSFDSKDAYVVNGHRSKLGQWPWVASLYRFGVIDYSFQCTASILSRRWILTAAHCLEKKVIYDRFGGYIYVKISNPKAYQIRVGGVDIKLMKPFEVEKLVEFGYDSSTMYNDIVLLKLKEDLVFNDKVQPICLTDFASFKKDFFTYEVCVAAGFGSIKHQNETDTREDYLVHGKMNLLPDDKCYEMLWKYPTSGFESYLCAGEITSIPGTNTCFGDSGGPLMCRKSSGVWVQVGVTSGGDKACQEDVYTKVPTFYDRIQNIINEDP